MSVTAARLGSAPITLDWSNFAAVSRNHTPDAAAIGDAWDRMEKRIRMSEGQAPEAGFYEAPLHAEISQAEESKRLASEILARGNIEDCLFLGIGGSSLGPLSLLNALPEKRNSIRFHVMESPDPMEWTAIVSRLRPQSTLVCVVAKSGTTFETLSQFLLALEWLGKERWKSQVVAITDPVKGDLKAFASAEGIPTLHIHPSMGGRYSVFTPVGLFPCALAGLSVDELVLGAKQVRDYVEKAPTEKNPLFILGSEFIYHYQKRPIHVCMPYSTRLKTVGAWFVQLWAESLGKDGKGFTPLAAVGPTDQHSILQLLRDGPDDKITLFVTVDQLGAEVKIPRTPTAQNRPASPAFRLLEGHSLNELMIVEYRAVSRVLTKQGRPNLTWQLDRLDERSLGALYFAFSVMTAFTGSLWNVNPFDQPGVEEGKVYIRESLQNSGQNSGQYGGQGEGGWKPEEEDDNSPVNRLRRNRE